MIERGDGSRYRTKWSGADPSDPLLCESTNGSGSKSTQRVFGRWTPDNAAGSAEEKAAFRASMTALMSGQATTAGFIIRGPSGEQIAQHWRISGGDTLDVGGAPLKTVVFTVGYVYAGNGRSWNTRLWFAPQYNLFVKSDGSLDLPGNFTWHVVKIRDPAPAAR